MGARQLSRIGGSPNLLRKSAPPPPATAAASRSLTAGAGAHAGCLPSPTRRSTGCTSTCLEHCKRLLCPTTPQRKLQSGERLVGQESVSTCRFRGTPYH